MSSDTFEQRSMARNAFGDRQFGTDDRDDTDRDDTDRDADGEIFDRDDLSDRNGAGDAALDSETEEQRLVQMRDLHEFADADAEDAVDRDLTDSAQGTSESSDSDAEMTEADLRGSEVTDADLTGSEVTEAEFATGEANDADGAGREATDEFTNADDSDADGVDADTVIDADRVAPDPDDIEDGYDRESNASDADRLAFDGIAADDADNRVIDGEIVDRDVSADDVSADDVSADDVSAEDVVAADLSAGPAGTGGDMLPGALPVEDDVVVPGVSDLKARWQQAQMGFIDDPAGSAESAAAIAAEALEAHIGALRDRLAELGAWQSRDQAAGVQATGVQDTEVLRGAVHGYRAFVQQIVGE
jgi:hypothetical protein